MVRTSACTASADPATNTASPAAIPPTTVLAANRTPSSLAASAWNTVPTAPSTSAMSASTAHRPVFGAPTKLAARSASQALSFSTALAPPPVLRATTPGPSPTATYNTTALPATLPAVPATAILFTTAYPALLATTSSTECVCFPVPTATTPETPPAPARPVRPPALFAPPSATVLPVRPGTPYPTLGSAPIVRAAVVPFRTV